MKFPKVFYISIGDVSIQVQWRKITIQRKEKVLKRLKSSRTAKYIFY